MLVMNNEIEITSVSIIYISMTIFYKKFNMKNTSSSSAAHSIIYNLTI